jgi:hypothetical protein
MTTSTRTTWRRAATAAVVTTATLIAFGVGGPPPAGAIGRVPAAAVVPWATIEVGCGIQGIDVDTKITNPDPVAHDVVVHYASYDWTVPVPAGANGYQASVDGIDDESPFDVSITLGGVVLASHHVDLADCFVPKAVLAFACGADGPGVTFSLTNEGKSRTLMRWAVDSQITSVDTLAEILAGAPAFETTIPLAEGQAFTATVSDMFSGQPLATLTGTATCVAPTTEPPPTEPPATTPPVTDPPITAGATTPATAAAPAEPTTTAIPAVVAAVSARPAFTG